MRGTDEKLVSFIEHADAIKDGLNLLHSIATEGFAVLDPDDVELQADQIVRRLAK